MPFEPRPYRQVARAAATADTGRRIVDAFEAALRARPVDAITLDQIATAAGTTRQTVIRLFGGKDGLLEAFAVKMASDVTARRALPDRPSARQATRVVVADYEIVGDFIVRLLAEEERHPVLTPFLDSGRAAHRAWCAGTFATALPADPAEREAMVTQIVIAFDVYTWKLLRRDFHYPLEKTEALIAALIAKIVNEE